MNNHCKFSETVAQNQISSPNPPARPKKSYSIVWKACLRLRLRHRHPRSAIPSIAPIASIAHRPASPHTMQFSKPQAQFFFGVADFFSAKRLFFRAARDVSGERSAPPWAREEIKLKMSFQSLSHSPSHDRAKALTSPPPDFLFISIHPGPTIPQSHHPPQTKIQKRNAEKCLLIQKKVLTLRSLKAQVAEW